MKDVSIPRLSLCVFGAFFFVYTLTSSPVAPLVGDGSVMASDAVHLLRSGFSEPEGFSKFGLGQALIDVPIAPLVSLMRTTPSPLRRLFLTLAISMLPSLIGSGICALFFLCCTELGYRRVASVLGTVLLGLTSMQWVYAQSLFAEPTIGLLWLGALYCVLRSRRPAAHVLWLVLAGSLCAYSVLVKPTAAVGLLVFGVYVVADQWGRRRSLRSSLAGPAVVGFLAPAIPVLALFFWFNSVRYGHMLNMGYSTGRDVSFGFSTPLLTGLYGLLFSSGKGLFWYNPTLFLAVFGVPVFARRHPRAAWLSAGLWVGVLLLHSRWWAWHGDWSWGPRFLVPLLPFGFLPAASLADRFLGASGVGWGNRVRIGLSVVLCAIGLWVQGVGLCIPYHNHILVVVQGARVFEQPLYDAAKWPIRDDMLQVRFIPEFSPIAGHWWLLRCTLGRDRASEAHVPVPPPWAALNPKWDVKGIAGFLHYNIWWMLCWQQRADLSGKVWLAPILVVFLLAGFAACAVCVVYLLRSSPPAGDERDGGEVDSALPAGSPSE